MQSLPIVRDSVRKIMFLYRKLHQVYTDVGENYELFPYKIIQGTDAYFVTGIDSLSKPTIK